MCRGHKATTQLSIGKAAGSDSIPPEIYKYGSTHNVLAAVITKLFAIFWTRVMSHRTIKTHQLFTFINAKGTEPIDGKILARVILSAHDTSA